MTSTAKKTTTANRHGKAALMFPPRKGTHPSVWALVFHFLLLCSRTRAFSFQPQSPKILVLGASGLVGRAITERLDKLGIPYVPASRSLTGLDVTSVDAPAQIQKLCRGCQAVISTVGSLTLTEQDHAVNAANGVAAIAAKQAGCQRFVVVGNDPRVRSLTASTAYAKGKEQAEHVIQQQFPGRQTCIIQPTFIYGGNEFSFNPPRIPDSVGQVAEDVLGLYPIQAVSGALPGLLGVVTAAPVSRHRVAAAAVNAALGLLDDDDDANGKNKNRSSGCLELATREAIVAAASRRYAPPKPMGIALGGKSVQALKQEIYNLGDCQGDADCLESAFATLEQIELLNQRTPARDPILNGRWNFVFDIEADIGTGVVKDVLEGNSPVKPVFNIQDLFMIISDENTKVTIHVKTRVLGIPMDVELTTKLHAITDTRFEEQFLGMKLMGMTFPVPESWQQRRPLEFTYLDEDMLIARGNGGEPHYLKR